MRRARGVRVVAGDGAVDVVDQPVDERGRDEAGDVQAATGVDPGAHRLRGQRLG